MALKNQKETVLEDLYVFAFNAIWNTVTVMVIAENSTTRLNFQFYVPASLKMPYFSQWDNNGYLIFMKVGEDFQVQDAVLPFVWV